MIEIVQKGPFVGGVTAWRGRSGESVHTVVVKGTYELAPIACVLLDRPRPLHEREEVYDGADASTGSVRFVSDLVPWKRAAEVIVIGSAYAPHERPAQSIVARVVVGEIDKAIEAFAPRRFRSDGTLEDATPTARVALRLESAGRGVDGENLAGADPTRPDARGFRPAPSILPPAFRLDHPDDDVPFIGLGALSVAQRRRTAGLRAEDREWLAEPNARRAPEGLDPDIFQVAPRDQRTETGFRPDTRILLENLHPRHARLVTNLPGIGPRAVLLGPREEDIPLVADTLVIDTDEGVATLTWRGYVSFDRAPTAAAILVMQAEPTGAPPFAGMPSMPNVLHVTTQRLNTVEMTQTDTDELGLGAQMNPLPFVRAEHLVVEDEITQATKAGLAETGAFGKLRRPTRPPPVPPSAPPPPSRSTKAPPPPPSRASIPSIPLPGREGPPPLPPSRAPALARNPPPAPPPPPPPSSTGVAPPPQPPMAPQQQPPMAPQQQPPMAPPMAAMMPQPALAPPLMQPAMAPSGPTPTMAPSGPQPAMAPSGPTPAIAPPQPIPPAPVSVRPTAPSSSAIPQPATVMAPSSSVGPIGFLGNGPPSTSSMGTSMGTSTSSMGSTLGTSMGSSTASTSHTMGSHAVTTATGVNAPTSTTPAGPPPPRDRPSGNGAALFDSAFGAKSASDAAAARERDGRDRNERQVRDGDPVTRRALVDLLAFDPALPMRLRRDPAHTKLLAKGAPPKAFLFPDEAAAKQSTDEGRGRWEVLRVLSVAAPLDVTQAREAVGANLDDDSQLEMPILIVGGELRPTFDEIKTLEAAAQIALPSSVANKALAPLVKLATDTAQGTWPPTREITLHIVKQLELAMTQSPNLPPKFFATQLERVLVEGRAYKRRVLLGAPRLRAELTFGAGDPVPIYLPETSNDLLPLLPSFPVVAAVELRPREDASETHPECLVAHAVGRVVRRVK